MEEREEKDKRVKQIDREKRKEREERRKPLILYSNGYGADTHPFLHPLQLRSYNLNYLKAQILPSTPHSSLIFTAVGDVEDCMHFSVGALSVISFLQ